MSEQDRIQNGFSSTNMLITNLGDPRPRSTMQIELPNGSVVSEDVFGKPPGDLSHDKVAKWYENRATELMTTDRRQLPDGRVISDPDAIRETADMTDEEAMAWLDIPEVEP
jgi:hypothetical protein